MTRHPLDGNALAADAHYDREEPETQDCPECDGRGWELDDPQRDCWKCHGSGEVPVEQEKPEAQERDE